ncbi:hypothetical protein RYA05_02030 [Pseudomonas syringae pv. actinidiae]|nr:hypothetical protein [Pseudomonas syringae pv. actinidiae]
MIDTGVIEWYLSPTQQGNAAVTYFLAKSFGIEAVQNFSYLSRPGIYWRWKSNVFDGKGFGTTLGTMNCFFAGGLHEYAHCIDFILNDRIDKITESGIKLSTPWEYWNDTLGCFDGAPKTAEMTKTEGRAHALQAYLMVKELGFVVEEVKYDEERALREEGKLDDLPLPEGSSSIFGRSEYTILKKLTAQEFIAEKRWMESHAGPDYRLFLAECGYDPDALSWKDRKAAWIEGYITFTQRHYDSLLTPEMGLRIEQAITTLGEHLSAMHARTGFMPDENYLRSVSELVAA